MKLYTLLFAVAFIAAGCSSSNDNSPMEDAETTSGDNTDVDESSTITVANYQTLLVDVFESMNSISVDSFIDDTNAIPIPELSNETIDIEGLTLNNRSFDSESGQDVLEFTCNAGGRYTFKQRGPFEFTYELESCQFMSNNFNGSFVRTLSDGTSETVFNAFEIIDDNNSPRTLTGKRFIRSSRFISLVNYDIERFAVGASANILELTGVDTNINHDIASPAPNPGERSFNSKFTVIAPWTDGQQMEVDMGMTFTNLSENSNYSTGVFSAISNDGSQLSVSADNGDSNSFQVDVIVDGSTSSFTENWSDGLRLRCLGDPFSEDPEYSCDN